MRMRRIILIAIAVTSLAACASTSRSPETGAASTSKSPPIAKSVPEKTSDAGAVDDPVRDGNEAGEESGLGSVVYNGKPLIECGRKLRTGSRIRRQVCAPDGFNGMYPSGGINMGTAKESQVPYGRN